MKKLIFISLLVLISALTAFGVSGENGVHTESENILSMTEQKIVQALEIFGHEYISGINLKQDTEGNYELSSEDMFFYNYQADFSMEGITLGRKDVSSVNLSFLSSALPEKMEEREGRVVYYFPDSLMVYTPIADGLKNDIILFEKPADDFSFSWQLGLIDEQMTARLEVDGSIGIYNVTQESFNEIDQRAKEDMQNQLIYTLPAPVIVEANGVSHNDLSYYELENNILKLKIKDSLDGLVYPISIDPTISFGLEYVFRPSWVSFDLDAVTLNSTHSLIVYGEGNDEKAVVATINGSIITYGPSYTFNSTAAQETVAVALDSTHVLIVYHDPAGVGGTAILATVNLTNSTITFGSPYVFNNLANFRFTITKLDSTHALISTSRNEQVAALVATVNLTNSSISFGSEYVFNPAGDAQYLSAVTLSPNKVLIAYKDDGDGGKGTAIVADVSGSVLNFGLKYIFNTGRAFYISASALDPGHAFISYNVGGIGKSIVAIVSGSVISFGPEYSSGPSPTGISVATLNQETVFISFIDFANANKGTAVIAMIDPWDHSIYFDPESIFNQGATVWNTHATALDYNRVLVAYEDDGNGGYGTAIVTPVGGVDPPTPVIYPPTITTNPALPYDIDWAQLNGSLTSLGGAASASVWFQWGLTTSYGNSTTPVSKSAPDTFFSVLNGLTPSTLYHFRAVGDNTAGTSYGIDRTFTTLVVPNSPPSASSVTSTPNTVTVGSNITFTGTWSDPNAGDNVKMYVCKDSTCLNCNNSSQANCWTYSTVWNTDTSDARAYT
ncbi:MAG: hypothetical protein ABH919_01140, partial [bacterium]